VIDIAANATRENSPPLKANEEELMHGNSNSYATWGFALLVGASLTGCGGSDQSGGTFASRPSRSSTIALSEDKTHVAMVNPDDGTLSVFQTSDNSRTAKVPTGNTPASVVIAPDGKTAYIANRADGTVVKITGIDGGTPAIDTTLQVGAEPVALALSPSGAKLFVAELASSEVSVVDTSRMTIERAIPVDRPRALLVTNNADANDDDETLAITQYYGTPTPGGESQDDGRTGKIQLASLGDLANLQEVTLSPLDSGFAKNGDPTQGTVKTSPNQLTSLATSNGRLYVTSVSASPEGPTRFDNNVFPVVYVADLHSGAEITDASGTTNLARKIYDAIPQPSATSPRFIPGDLADLDFLGTSNVAYTIGRAGDVMVRVTFGSTVDIGSTVNKEIDLGGNDTVGKCQEPTGLAIDPDAGKAYVNCWVTRRMAIVDFATQAMVQTVEAAPQPATAADQSVLRGKRFYFTGRGRWSAAVANAAKGGEGWSSCGSCHPDGLTDNITWSFNTGPRQTVSQDGTFSHGPGPQKQRLLNHTAIFEEHHDFERNTRDVSGGLGAITTAAQLSDCNQLDKEIQVALTIDGTATGTAIGGLAKPLKELANDPTVATCGHKDWDDIEAYVKTIQPVHASKLADAGAIARGRQLFIDGGCAKCHGGAGWTVSRLFYAPTSANTTALSALTQPFVPPAFFPATWTYATNAGQPRPQLSAQPPIAADETGRAEPAPIAVGQAACVLRNVGTFGLPGDDAGTSALEIRLVKGIVNPAEGRGGFNVPSLYGLALGAPYLHHGQAATLSDLFTDDRWRFHTNAANANFSVTLAQSGKLADLTAFLLSIDASTEEIPVPTDPVSGGSFDACPVSFP
jgi:DNA-binding beta-propeller fold protein YncE